MLNMNFLSVAVQKLQPKQSDTHSEGQTQTDLTEIIAYLHTRMVNIFAWGLST